MGLLKLITAAFSSKFCERAACLSQADSGLASGPTKVAAKWNGVFVSLCFMVVCILWVHSVSAWANLMGKCK